jgi:formate C-acetyltransferase
MSLFTTDAPDPMVKEKRPRTRIERLRDAVQNAAPGICTDRALLWTSYYKNPNNRKKPAAVQMAEALREVLLNKKITIYPDELIVGNFSSRRVGGSLFPELHGIPVMMDTFKFSKRETNPLQISGKEIWSLLKIVPFWMLRFMALKAYRSPIKTIRLLLHQLKGTFYIINESGGISHIAPDYEKLINIGTEGIVSKASEFQQQTKRDTGKWVFYEGVKIAGEALARFGERYAERAEKMAESEPDTLRKMELKEIAAVCRKVPRKGASSFQEALQSLFFAQVALNLESLDNAVCPGRMDQYLYPFYERDVKSHVLTREKAKELISAFSIKMSEIIPVFSEYLTGIHGGMFNGQVVTVGGLGRDGKDATNDLSYIFLEVMDELRMRQPNYHARISEDSRPCIMTGSSLIPCADMDTKPKMPGITPGSDVLNRCHREKAFPPQMPPL